MTTKTGIAIGLGDPSKHETSTSSSVLPAAPDATDDHDQWFREQVEMGLTEADSPGAEWVTHDEAKSHWADLRAELSKKALARKS